MNEILNFENIENSEKIENNSENIENIETIETITQEQQAQETQEQQEKQEQEQKRKRGRPKKTQKETQQKQKDNKDDFLNDLVEHRFVDNVSGDTDIIYTTEDDTSEIQLPPIKDTLLFLDNLICYALKRFLKKNIEPMSDEDAEFIAKLAPQDLQLLKPSKETFFYTLIAYYLLKIF
jgi:hypothetical protein